jgi:diacylglycerol kinase (ATP)
MIAAALLHPDVAPDAIEPFRDTNSILRIQDNLEDKDRPDAALLFGGDGTVHRHLPGLCNRRVPMLVVPTGSGNDFAKALGIRNQAIALRAWRSFCEHGDNVRSIDLGVLTKDRTTIPFCCVAGAGMDSAANAKANRMPRWLRGSAGYLAAALQVLPSYQPAEFSLSADEREIRRCGFLVAVANAYRYGRGMRIAPRAELDDGLLDVCLVGKMSKLKLLLAVPTVFFGAHLRIKQLEYLQARALRLDADRPLDVYADGEFAGQTPVDIALMPRALSVIVPLS